MQKCTFPVLSHESSKYDRNTKDIKEKGHLIKQGMAQDGVYYFIVLFMDLFIYSSASEVPVPKRKGHHSTGRMSGVL